MHRISLGCDFMLTFQQPWDITSDCRMTNYKLLQWLVETLSCNVHHYRMINVSWSTVYHCNDTSFQVSLTDCPRTVSCFSKIQIGFTFLVPANLGSTGKRAAKWVCVCVYASWSSPPFCTTPRNDCYCKCLEYALLLSYWSHVWTFSQTNWFNFTWTAW